MKAILRQSNLDLLGEIEQIKSILQNRFQAPETSTLAQEFVPYYQAIVSACDRMHRRVIRTLGNLDLGYDNILGDILSETQETTRLFHLYNQRLLSPLLRYQESDRQCLKLLNWLHAQHPPTQMIPAGMSDGEFGIWPVRDFPIVYFMPTSAQYGLLYLPLFFHEFGHLLYACHKQELNDLVRDLLERIDELLKPIAQRDGHHSQIEAARRNRIVETWHEWIQELYCDNVGFWIGGPSFGHAFSTYLCMRGRGEFHIPKEQLAYRDHPVTWLRIRMLADQMRQANFHQQAMALEETWKSLAEAMGIQEEYFGYYDDAFLPLLQQTIEDMLTETNPRRFAGDEIFVEKPVSSESSPIHLLNHAWAAFFREPTQYGEWQKQIMAAGGLAQIF